MTQQGKILRFWRDVEIFTIPSPATTKDQQKPGPSSSLPTISVNSYVEPQDLPWLPPMPTPQDFSRTHTIYLGVQGMEPLAAAVLQAVAPSARLGGKDFEAFPGQGCLGVFCVNHDGVPIAETYTVASFVLGVAAYRKGTCLDGLSHLLVNAQKRFDERRFAFSLDSGAANPAIDGSSAETGGKQEAEPGSPHTPFTWKAIREECQILFECLGIFLPEQIRITIKTTDTPTRQSKKQDNSAQPQPELLNSFYLNDLDALIRQCDRNEAFGAALTAYLSEPSDEDSRRDILAEDSAMFDMLNPLFISSGRWPSPSRHHLTLGQQAAVSGILARTSTGAGGLVAVNGPPGTGKTTLLSDVIAEVVTRRAENICTYDKPWQILGNKTSSAGYPIFPLKQDVARHTGIVVSSNNNSAVENITLDLPSWPKIAYNEHPDASYFQEVIKGIFSRSEIPAEPWGLVAGALGSKANRRRFFDGFLWGSRDKCVRGMVEILKAIPKDDAAEKKWHETKKKFLSLKHRVDAQKKEFSDCYQALRVEPRLQQLNLLLQEANTLIAALRLDKENCDAATELARLDAPGLFIRMAGSLGLKTQAYVTWNIQQKKAQQALQANIQKQKEVQARNDGLRAEKTRLETTRAQQNAKTKSGQGNFGPIPDKRFFAQHQDDRQLSHVWTTDAFDLLRSQYFLAALELHEATVLACSGKFAANFKALNSMMTGQDFFDQEARATLWDTLFFTVPVISTTLASFDRLFAGTEQGSIGWLLIDEAGQATPQSVAGALWRSQRAVIIGDPLQIEPVLTIPEQLVAHIQNKYGLEDDWSPKVHSAQTLADRTMDAGAWVGSGESAVWTGIPLRTHRRCADPMFSISNSIAYGNQMVQGNITPPSIDCCLKNSKWFDVQATSSDGHIVKAEMETLRELLHKISSDWPMVSKNKKSSIYIISPFRRVAMECRRIVTELGLGDEILVGTVHTFQGKEADIVFIVLGSAQGQAGAGSRSWASEKPNLLNVALTRAKLLVYVIGNLEEWKLCKGFDELAEKLSKNSE